MPIWSEVLQQLKQSSTGRPNGQPDFDGVRRGYLAALHRHTGRNTILYASGWLQKSGVSPDLVGIVDEDIQALMETTHGLAGEKLDIVLHSPGGEAEAAEAVVSYLRSRFSDIRVIVPNLAMSAATMWACAANEIVLGKHSFLGPTDPQLNIPTGFGVRAVAAQAVIDQFDRAYEECADPQKLAVWFPVLMQYAPDLLARCESAIGMCRDLVASWLESFMFSDLEDGKDRAEEVSKWLTNHKAFQSHGRHIPRDTLREKGLVITNLEKDEVLQDLSLSVFHATTHTFSGTAAVKIVENHLGRAFVKAHQPNPPVMTPPIEIQVGGQPPALPPTSPA